jgi:hypothetical protein
MKASYKTRKGPRSIEATRNEVISIFGEAEEVVARKMMVEGKGVGLLAPTNSVRIQDVPTSARFNKFAQEARRVSSSCQKL